MAMDSSQTLAPMAIRVKEVARGRLKPSVYLRPMAQATSNRPATNRTNQAVCGFTEVCHAGSDSDAPSQVSPSDICAAQRGCNLYNICAAGSLPELNIRVKHNHATGSVAGQPGWTEKP